MMCHFVIGNSRWVWWQFLLKKSFKIYYIYILYSMIIKGKLNNYGTCNMQTSNWSVWLLLWDKTLSWMITLV